ncbi:hypothetical protein EBU71_22450, partial [bacterium]|nr:hypothetical protein [Candidatus Elulimicrobium humile]
WTRVGVYIRAGGHSSGSANGERSIIGSFNYTGLAGGVAGFITLQNLVQGDGSNNSGAPNFNFWYSGWEAAIEMRGTDGAPAGFWGGFCYLELNFGGGEGGSGEQIVWNITEYY